MNVFNFLTVAEALRWMMAHRDRYEMQCVACKIPGYACSVMWRPMGGR